MRLCLLYIRQQRSTVYRSCNFCCLRGTPADYATRHRWRAINKHSGTQRHTPSGVSADLYQDVSPGTSPACTTNSVSRRHNVNGKVLSHPASSAVKPLTQSCLSCTRVGITSQVVRPVARLCSLQSGSPMILLWQCSGKCFEQVICRSAVLPTSSLRFS